MEDSMLDQVAPKTRGGSRLSRLPRATASTAYSDGRIRLTQHVKSTHTNPANLIRASAFGDETDNAEGSRFGWKSQPAGKTPPLEDSSSAERGKSDGIDSMKDDKVPDTSTDEQDTFSMGNANNLHVTSSKELPRKTPRPSLSERTIETMSHVPPSPSPSRRKSSLSMLPPLRPISPTAQRSPKLSGLTSPNMQSPSKLRSPVPILRPHRTSVMPQATPVMAPSQRKVNNTTSGGQQSPEVPIHQMSPELAAKPSLAAHKVRSLRDLRSSTKQPVRKASLNFRDVAPSSNGGSHVASTVQTASPIVKPRIPSAKTPSKLRKRPSILENQVKQPSVTAEEVPGPKSSATLRETIAKAKAARKQAMSSTTTDSSDAISNRLSDEHSADTLSPEGISSQSFKKRIRSAVSSGILNVAALGLTTIPVEILNMYNPIGDAHSSWSEAVDLTKFIVADNDIEKLPENVFPDWSIEELQEDEDKSNIFGGLEILDFRGNKLSQLPIGLRRLERLHSLNLSNNKLTCDALTVLSQLSNLRDISLANNDLRGHLPESVSQLTSLHTLDIHDNKLTGIEVSFSTLTKLRKLDVSGNLIESLPMVDLEVLHMTDFNASRNRLSSVALSPGCAFVQAIHNLNLSFNSLTRLWSDDVEFQQLQSLNVDSNHLERVPNLSRFTSLMTITASENRLTELPDGFVELQSLRTANFGSNDIRILDPYISKMDDLSVLNLAGNPLRERKYLNMPTADLKTELAKRLTAVYIRDENNATPAGEHDAARVDSPKRYKVEKGCLDLSSRDIEELETSNLDNTSVVHTLDLSKNRLPTFPVEFLRHSSISNHLRTLTLSHNVTFNAESYIASPLDLPALRSLSLASTGINCVDALTKFVNAPALAEVNLCCNRFRGPMPSLKQHFLSLTTLLISDNEITSITPDSISGLEVVDIKNNDIEFLPPKIGELGNITDEKRPGRLRTFECSGNKFRVPRLVVVEKGTEAILRDLRRMVITDELGEEWRT